MSFYQYLKEHAYKDPSHPAIIEGDTCLSYGDFVSQIECFASALSKFKLNANSKIGLLCLNQKEYLVAYFAALLKGVPVIPFNFMLKPEDLVYITQDAGIDTLIIDSTFVKPEITPFFKFFPNKILIGPADSDQVGEGTISWNEFMALGDPNASLTKHKRGEGLPDVILYTSGTTAKPKGVMLEENQFDANCTGFLEHLHFTPEDKVIVALPLFHSFGNIMALALLRSGATLILLKQFQPKTILESIAQHKATILPLVPTIYSFLVQLYARGGYDVSSLRYCISGGASLPEALLKRVEEGLGVTVIEGYGLTETSPVIAVNTMKDGSVPASVGPILPNVELEIVDEAGKSLKQGEVGEIRVRGETVMKGYWKKSDATAETLSADGWLKTGDVATMDADGFVTIVDRVKDMLISGGENVYPAEIENVLLSHEKITDAGVIGIPSAKWGESPLAVIVRADESISAEDVMAHCVGKLAPFKTVKAVEFVEEIPRNASGKILKRQLREQFNYESSD